MNQEHAIFGGNRCYTVSPSDTAPALIALGATRHRFTAPTPRELPLEDLFMPPGENITVMHRVTPGTVLSRDHGACSPRNALDIHQVRDAQLVGLRHRQRRSRAAGRQRHRLATFASCSEAWRRSRGAARTPSGRSRAGHSIETTIESAARAAIAAAHPLAHNEYKVALVKKLVRTALTELAQ